MVHCISTDLIAARALATYLIPGCVGRGVRLGSESSSGGGGVWKSGNHEIWSEMGPYGSIWLDTTAKLIVRTLHIFFVFKKSLKKCLGSKQEAQMPAAFPVWRIKSMKIMKIGLKSRSPKFWNLCRKGLDRSKILKSLTQGFGQVQNSEIFDAKSWKFVWNGSIWVGRGSY